MQALRKLGLVIVGTGVGGIICPQYARKAGHNAVVLDNEPVTGGQAFLVHPDGRPAHLRDGGVPASDLLRLQFEIQSLKLEFLKAS